jgi:hypothetical protein
MNTFDDLLKGHSKYNPYKNPFHPLSLHGEDHIASQLIGQINDWYYEIAQNANKLFTENPEHPDLSSECQIAVLRQMARSQVVIATIAPLIETTLCRMGKVLGESASKITRKDTKRWTCSDDVIFNPKKYIEDDGTAKDNIIDGPWQLLKAIGKSDKITSESKAFQIFTFRYRNFSLHNGYYWDSESIAKMMRVINSDGWNKWVDTVTSNEDITMITLSDEYINNCLSCFEKLFNEYVSVLSGIYET